MSSLTERTRAGRTDETDEFWIAVILLLGLIDLVKQTAIGEVNFLRLGPTARDFLHALQLQRFEAVRILRQDGGVLRTEVVLGG